jgi:hypothetical protein
MVVQSTSIVGTSTVSRIMVDITTILRNVAPMSSVSLKALIPPLATAIGMTPAAMYERQRALVRAGLLQVERGRGPGSGVRATPDSAATLLMATLVSGSLSETEQRTRAVARLKSVSERCPLTGKKSFGSALTAILASEDIAKRVRWIDYERSSTASVVQARGSVHFMDNPDEKIGEHKVRHSEFGHKYARYGAAMTVRVSLALNFSAVARTLRNP